MAARIKSKPPSGLVPAPSERSIRLELPAHHARLDDRTDRPSGTDDTTAAQQDGCDLGLLMALMWRGKRR